MATGVGAFRVSALSCFKSEHTSAACWKCFFVIFFHALGMYSVHSSGSHGFTLLAAEGCPFRIAFIVTTRFLPAKGRLPVVITKSTQCRW